MRDLPYASNFLAGFPCGDHPSKRFAPTYPFPYSCVAQVPTQHGSSSYQQQQQSYGSFPPTYHREQPPSQYESQGFAEDQPPTLQDASDDYRTHYEHLESESNHRLKRTRTWTEHEPAPNATTAASIDTHFPHMQELSESIQSPPAETSGNAATDEHESDEDVVSIRMHPHFVIPSARHMPSLLPGSVVEEMFVNTMSEDQLMCSRQKTSRTSALQIVLYRPPTLPLPSAVVSTSLMNMLPHPRMAPTSH